VRETNLYYRLGSQDREVREDAITAYQQWLNDPVTQDVIECITHMQNVMVELPLPADGVMGNGISSAQRMWQLHGLRIALSRMESMDKEAYQNLQKMKATQSDTARPHDDFFNTPVAT